MEFISYCAVILSRTAICKSIAAIKERFYKKINETFIGVHKTILPLWFYTLMQKC